MIFDTSVNGSPALLQICAMTWLQRISKQQKHPLLKVDEEG